MYAGDEQLFGALEAGASAFVAKDAPSDDVVAAARHASVSPRSFTAADLAEAMRRKLTPTGPQLSARESEVLSLLAEGLGVAAIARQLFVSRVDGEDAHLEDLREARRREPRPGDHDRDALRAARGDDFSRSDALRRVIGRGPVAHRAMVHLGLYDPIGSDI